MSNYPALDFAAADRAEYKAIKKVNGNQSPPYVNPPVTRSGQQERHHSADQRQSWEEHEQKVRRRRRQDIDRLLRDREEREQQQWQARQEREEQQRQRDFFGWQWQQRTQQKQQPPQNSYDPGYNNGNAYHNAYHNNNVPPAGFGSNNHSYTSNPGPVPDMRSRIERDSSLSDPYWEKPGQWGWNPDYSRVSVSGYSRNDIHMPDYQDNEGDEEHERQEWGGNGKYY